MNRLHTMLVYAGGAPILCGAIFALFHFGASLWPNIYRNLEIVGILGTLALVALMSAPLSGVRPFTHVPLDGRWWEYLVFGVTASLLGIVSCLLMLCPTVVIPIIIPIKLLQSWVLSSGATLITALITFPVVFVCTSVAFAAVYLWALVNGKGNLVRNQKPLYSGAVGEGWPFTEVYYFSLSTMLKGSPQYEGSGACRWIALAEIAVARLLEIGIVTVGIGAILKRAVPQLPH